MNKHRIAPRSLFGNVASAAKAKYLIWRLRSQWSVYLHMYIAFVPYLCFSTKEDNHTNLHSCSLAYLEMSRQRQRPNIWSEGWDANDQYTCTCMLHLYHIYVFLLRKTTIQTYIFALSLEGIIKHLCRTQYLCTVVILQIGSQKIQGIYPFAYWTKRRLLIAQVCYMGSS